jgi:hypothetical protein
MRKIIGLMLFISIAFLGCRTGDGTGPPPVSPFEAKIAAQNIMSFALIQENMDRAQLEALQSVFTGARFVMLNTLSADPTELEPVTRSFLVNVDPVYQDLAEGIIQILLLRIKPYIDTTNPDLALARSYIEAVLDGAIAGINRALTRLETRNGSQADDASEQAPVDTT